MASMSLTLELSPDVLAVCRLAPDSALPAWALAARFFSITRTADEVSIVCAAGIVPPGVSAVGGWRRLRVAGTLDFALTGILAALAQPLADAGVSVFAVATYNTDYLLVRERQLAEALAALGDAGHRIVPVGDAVS